MYTPSRKLKVEYAGNQIVTNLKSHHGKWVNTACTLRDCELGESTSEALVVLMQSGQIRKRVQRVGNQNLTWYRYNTLGN